MNAVYNGTANVRHVPYQLEVTTRKWGVLECEGCPRSRAGPYASRRALSRGSDVVLSPPPGVDEGSCQGPSVPAPAVADSPALGIQQNVCVRVSVGLCFDTLKVPALGIATCIVCICFSIHRVRCDVRPRATPPAGFLKVCLMCSLFRVFFSFSRKGFSAIDTCALIQISHGPRMPCYSVCVGPKAVARVRVLCAKLPCGPLRFHCADEEAIENAVDISVCNVPSFLLTRQFFVQHLLNAPQCLSRIAKPLHNLVIELQLG